MLRRFFAFSMIALLLYSTFGQVMQQFCVNKMESSHTLFIAMPANSANFPADHDDTNPIDDPICSFSMVDILETEATFYHHEFVFSTILDHSSSLSKKPHHFLKQDSLESPFLPPESV